MDDTGDNEPEQSDKEMADDVTSGRSWVRLQRSTRATQGNRARSCGGHGCGCGVHSVHAFGDEVRPPNIEDPDSPDFTSNSGLKVPLSNTTCADLF